MRYCTPEIAGQGFCECSVCGNRWRSSSPEQCLANCRGFRLGTAAVAQPRTLADEPAFTCAHRGEQLRAEKNRLCGCDTAKEPIYACQIHTECSLRKYRADGRGVRVCLSCGDRTA